MGKNFGDRNTLGDGNTFGNDNAFGNSNKLGDGNTLGDWNTFGNHLKIGKRFTCEGVKVYAFMCLSNVDGSGRQIQVFIHKEGILIRAGCFKGNLEEFCKKAQTEGKTRYAAVVKAAALALQQDCLDKNDTGGWE